MSELLGNREQAIEMLQKVVTREAVITHPEIGYIAADAIVRMNLEIASETKALSDADAAVLVIRLRRFAQVRKIWRQSKLDRELYREYARLVRECVDGRLEVDLCLQEMSRLDAELELHPEVDKKANSVLPKEKGSDNKSSEEEAGIEDGPAKYGTEVDAGAAFTDAVAALKSRLIPTVTDQDVADLEAVIHSAQQNQPADREGFVRDVRRMLEAGGMRLEVEGIDETATLSMKNGSIQVQVSRRGTRAFRTARIKVVRPSEPDFSSWKPQDRSSQTPSNQ